MPRKSKAVISLPACEVIGCRDCGMYRLCRLASDGRDPSVFNNLVKRRLVLKRGHYLSRSGDSFQGIYAVRHGSVKTYVYGDDGRMQITDFVGPGELIGLDAIEPKRFVTESVVLETTSVCEVPYENFQGLSKEIPDLKDQMIGVMSRTLHRHQQMLLLLGKKNAYEKIATYLLNIARLYNNRSQPPSYQLTMSRRDIGNYLGLTPETVCRIFADLQAQNLIRFQRKRVQLIDICGLEAIACG